MRGRESLSLFTYLFTADKQRDLEWCQALELLESTRKPGTLSRAFGIVMLLPVSFQLQSYNRNLIDLTHVRFINNLGDLKRSKADIPLRGKVTTAAERRNPAHSSSSHCDYPQRNILKKEDTPSNDLEI